MNFQEIRLLVIDLFPRISRFKKWSRGRLFATRRILLLLRLFENMGSYHWPVVRAYLVFLRLFASECVSYIVLVVVFVHELCIRLWIISQCIKNVLTVAHVPIWNSNPIHKMSPGELGRCHLSICQSTLPRFGCRGQQSRTTDWIGWVVDRQTDGVFLAFLGALYAPVAPRFSNGLDGELLKKFMELANRPTKWKSITRCRTTT